MSLVPYPDIESLPEETRSAISKMAAPLNIFKMMANAETCFVPLVRLGGTILSRQKLAANLREMVILKVAKLSGGEYEWVQHVPIALAVGVTQAQIDALAQGATEAACFSDADRAVLRFAEEVAQNVKANEVTVREVMKFLSPREIVELILAVGFYRTMACLTETTRVDLDPPMGTKVVDRLRR
ncbi:MAG TPA: carboxymuconolactone decarboxylase family protein [Candidatus Binataceae bacterium]|nr:carboxymuconolactone decarboxylase family protein [Candidatus Binataceae bacterium]